MPRTPQPAELVASSLAHCTRLTDAPALREGEPNRPSPARGLLLLLLLLLLAVEALCCPTSSARATGWDDPLARSTVRMISRSSMSVKKSAGLQGRVADDAADGGGSGVLVLRGATDSLRAAAAARGTRKGGDGGSGEASGFRFKARKLSLPTVNVPVLSSTATVALDNCSNASPDFKVMPLLAAAEVPDRKATGTPMTSGQGVAPFGWWDDVMTEMSLSWE